MQTWHDYLDNLEDVFIIEGYPPSAKKKQFAVAMDTVKPGGWIMLGNANRPEYAKERAELKAKAASVKTFDANEGGSKFRIVEFYKMPGRARKAKDDERETAGEG